MSLRLRNSVGMFFRKQKLVKHMRFTLAPNFCDADAIYFHLLTNVHSYFENECTFVPLTVDIIYFFRIINLKNNSSLLLPSKKVGLKK